MNEIMEETKVGGATLTNMLGTSAWYAPGAAVSSLVQAIACDQHKMFPCSIYLYNTQILIFFMSMIVIEVRVSKCVILISISTR